MMPRLRSWQSVLAVKRKATRTECMTSTVNFFMDTRAIYGLLQIHKTDPRESGEVYGTLCITSLFHPNRCAIIYMVVITRLSLRGLFYTICGVFRMIHRNYQASGSFCVTINTRVQSVLGESHKLLRNGFNFHHLNMRPCSEVGDRVSKTQCGRFDSCAVCARVDS